MPLVPSAIEQSARGMIRNFGNDAARRALQTAGRYARADDQEACETWTAIAERIQQWKGRITSTDADRRDRIPQP